jgi:hypothetical protein
MRSKNKRQEPIDMVQPRHSSEIVQPMFNADFDANDALPRELPMDGYLDSNGVRHFPDGSKVIGESPQEEIAGDNIPDEHYANLAEFLDEQTLLEIGNHLQRCIEEDIESQQQYFQAVADIINLLGIKSVESLSEDSEGEPTVNSSALFETLLDYVATIMASIFPSKGPVSTVIYGDSSPELEDISYRKSQWFNYYLQQVDKGFDKELKRAVVWSVITGSIYCKVFIDEVLGRPTMRMLNVEDYIVNRDVSSHLSANRKTWIRRMDQRELDLRKLSKYYRDIEILPSSYDGEGENVIKDQLDEISGYDPIKSMMSADNIRYEIYETDVDYYIKEDPQNDGLKIALPYLISLDGKSGRILRIERNWKKGDFLKKNNESIFNFSLLPSLDGEGYGLTQCSGSLAQAATVITRQLLKAGLYSNFPGGVYQAGMRLENNTLRPMPGEFLPVQTGGIPIQQAIQALPYKEPSPALNDLKNQIEDSIRKPSAIINQKVSEMAPRAPVGTVLAMLESLQKVPNFVIQGYHKSFQNMLELFDKCFAEWLPENQPYPFMVPGGSHVIMKSDFNNNIRVIPASDPSLQNSTYRFMRAEIILNNARQGADIHDMRYANELFYRNLNITDEEIHKLLPAPKEETPVLPLDPITENQNILTGKPVKAGIDQDHDAHMMVHNSLQENPVAAQDQNVIAAMQAHVKEHAALKLLIEMQAKIGFQMPEDPSKVPIALQNQIAVLSAQQLMQQQQEQQQQTPPDPQLISAQALMEDVQVKKLQTEMRAEIDKLKLTLEQQSLQLEERRLEIDYEKMMMDSENKAKELQIKFLAAEGKQSLDERKVDIDLLQNSQVENIIHQNTI